MRIGFARALVAAYRDPRLLVILVMGFASGLPLLLTLSTLAAWMAMLGASKTTIGLFALVGLPYSLKFLWSPLIDGVRLPLLGRLGRRRGWAILTQILLILAILALGATDPVTTPYATALAALAVAFCSASQDIVIDAYRVEILAEAQQGAGAAVTQVGYRIGLLAAGAGALYVAQLFGWWVAFLSVAALVGVGILAVLLAPEPVVPTAATAAARGSAGAWLRHHLIGPFTEFSGRRGWALILLFILLYKLGDAFAGVMANPFYLEMGFSLAEIASVSKVFGMLATLGGALLGGVVVARFAVFPALLGCGLLQMLSNLMFAAQALVGHSVPFLMLTIGVENLAGGMGSAAFVAYLSGLCNVAFTATQYALFSSFMAVGRTVLSSGAGWLADHTSWVVFFLLSTALAAPGLLLLPALQRQERATARG
ncbi:MAG: MFS transporter [Alphaproteobacteria bacterium]|nr:MFS transporter [Alphaproteobacteria bacterium]